MPFRSHPVRVRGLEPTKFILTNVPSGVAPRAGAWIETSRPSMTLRAALVAPRAGAWIETLHWEHKRFPPQSHPVRVRGLKLAVQPFLCLQQCRTPCGCVD